MLNINELHDIFETINQLYSISPTAEITLEANPDDITKERLLIWQRFGINRLSIGIQSFNNDYLAYMNRIHTSQMATESVLETQSVGIYNISIDLIYGVNPMNSKPSKRKSKSDIRYYSIPEMHDNWEKDLDLAFKLNVPHISSYCLTIEEKTVFGNWLKNNQIKDVDDEFAEKQFKTLQNQMLKKGYEQYEISNFAKNKHYAVHNTSYWLGDEYLGVGPSAHSFNGKSRQYNIANNTAYINALDKHQIPFTLEDLTQENRFNELIMTGLRTKWGVDLSNLKSLGVAIPVSFYTQIEELQKQGKLVLVNDNISLTLKGRFLADGIASSLFI